MNKHAQSASYNYNKGEYESQAIRVIALLMGESPIINVQAALLQRSNIPYPEAPG